MVAELVDAGGLGGFDGGDEGAEVSPAVTTDFQSRGASGLDLAVQCVAQAIW